MTGDFKWLAEELARISRSQAQSGAARTNPNPPGTIHEGSTTDAVLAVLKANVPRFLSFAAIKAATGRSGKALGWSLWHLQRSGQIDAKGAGDRRSPLYKQYKLKESKGISDVLTALPQVSKVGRRLPVQSP